jgi:glycosyltransferase involved in cell wall biosynthesis
MTPERALRSIRVAHVIQNLNYGGMERVLHSLARSLPSRGFEIHVVVLQYLGRFAEELEDSVTFHQVRPMSRLSLLHPGKLIDVLKQIQPDVVHSHSGVWLKASNAARSARIPVVVHTEHGRPDPVPLPDRLIDNRASRWTDAIIAVSDPLADLLRRQVVHDPARIRIIANGVDTERLRPPTDRSGLRQELGIPEGTPVVGSIGRLEAVKHYDLAIRAFARLGQSADGRAPWLVLVGDGSERAGLERLATELGVTDRVKFLGWRQDADRIYGAFDLFTLTSRSEGTSVSLLEAMSSGVCPVVTDVGGNRAVLGTELDSLLVADDDERALVAAWRRYLDDAPLRRTIGQRARRRVEEAFSLRRMVDDHAALYRELLGPAARAFSNGRPLRGRA